MMTPDLAIVCVAATDGPAALTKEQKAFNSLIKKIEKQRKQLQAWHLMLPVYQAKFAGELLPLQRSYQEGRKDLVLFFDQAVRGKGLTKLEKTKATEIIVSMAADLLSIDEDDLDLLEIYDRYSPVGFLEEQGMEEELDAAFMKAMVGNLFGAEMAADLEGVPPDEVFARVEEKVRQRAEQGEASGPDSAAPFGGGGGRAKSAKALAQELKRLEAEKVATQSIREIYRKLASALHPDREPDANERLRKTALMQRVNSAYEKNDLMQLLELQLEVAQIDQASISALTDARLKQYNKLLKAQSAELQLELRGMEDSFHFGNGFGPRISALPGNVIKLLDTDIKQLQATLTGLKADLKAFADPKKLKAWLKHYQLEPDYSADEEDFDMDLFF